MAHYIQEEEAEVVLLIEEAVEEAVAEEAMEGVTLPLGHRSPRWRRR